MTPRYLTDDAWAGRVARKLRHFDDRALAWIPYLSECNRMLICAHLDCDEFILDLAQRYETQRRLAYPIRPGGPVDAPSDATSLPAARRSSIAGNRARIDPAVDASISQKAAGEPTGSPYPEIGPQPPNPVGPSLAATGAHCPPVHARGGTYAGEPR